MRHRARTTKSGWGRPNHGRALRSQHPGGQEPPESWFFGRVAETFFIAGIEGSDRSLLLVYDGDADYENLKDQTMEGVCEEINSRHRSYLAGGGFVFPPKTELQQSVDEGPASYRQLMILCTVLAVIIDLLDGAVLA